MLTHYRSLSPQAKIYSLRTPLKWQAPRPSCNYQSRVKVIATNKHTSLLWTWSIIFAATQSIVEQQPGTNFFKILKFFVISQSACPFQAIYSRVGSWAYLQARKGSFAMDRHSSLLRTFENNVPNFFDNTGSLLFICDVLC